MKAERDKKPVIQTIISKQKGFLTVEIPKGAVGKPALKNRGRSMAPEVANYTDKAKLQRQ